MPPGAYLIRQIATCGHITSTNPPELFLPSKLPLQLLPLQPLLIISF